ncbi:MAG: hypothetical protein HC763_05980 [Hydrococcus sp. CRU_1_1]|nr:hypothetical protein [Hydrococcus sp. CRU_1_1]
MSNVYGIVYKTLKKYGVEFLSLPPLYCDRKETKLSIRTVVDCRRSFNPSYQVLTQSNVFKTSEKFSEVFILFNPQKIIDGELQISPSN